MLKSEYLNSSMETHSTSSSLTKQTRTLVIFLVVAGYILTFLTAAWGTTQFSLLQVVIGVLFGVVFIALGMFDIEILKPFTTNTRHALYFLIQITLVFGIGWTLGPGGTWLIGLPLASVAVERLTPRWRWPVYAGLLAAIVLPILRYSTVETAWMNAIIIATGIFFVVLTSQIRMNEQRAREKAEHLARQLEIANRRLVEYAAQAEELAAVQERNRLAREVHDNIGHYLTIVNVQIEAARVLMASDSQRALDALEKAQAMARKGLSSVRESVAALRVSPVENRSLEEAISELVNEAEVTGLTAQIEILGKPRTLDGKVALALYRAAQEGLTNVRKHACASHIDVELDYSQASSVRLTVRDDGAGAVDTSSGFGLVGMRERILLLGGDFRIETQPGKGFYLEVILPDLEKDGI
jgi:signal transduction histidine kinase